MSTTQIIVLGVAVVVLCALGTVAWYEGKMIKKYEEYELACEKAYDEGWLDGARQRDCDRTPRRSKEITKRTFGDSPQKFN